MKNITALCVSVVLLASCKVHHNFVHTVRVRDSTVQTKMVQYGDTRPNAGDSVWVGRGLRTSYVVEKPFPPHKKVGRKRALPGSFIDRYGNPVIRGLVIKKDSTSRQLKLANAAPLPFEESFGAGSRGSVDINASSIWKLNNKLSLLVAGNFFIEHLFGVSTQNEDKFETWAAYGGVAVRPQKGLYLGAMLGVVSTHAEAYHEQHSYSEEKKFQPGIRLFARGAFPKHFFWFNTNLITRRFNMSGYWHTFIGKKTTAGVYVNNITAGIGPMIGGCTRHLMRFSFAVGYNPLRQAGGFALILH